MAVESKKDESDIEPEPIHHPLEKSSYGYTRLTFFKFKIWQLTLIFLLLIGLAFVLFPRGEMLISYYIHRGMLNEALAELSDIKNKSTDPASLLKLSADVYRLMGNPLMAIESLESLIQEDPDNPNRIQDLVTLYEGIRNSKKLIGALEQQTKENPQDVQSLQSLIDGYHYDGIVNKHVDAIVRLIKMEKTMQPKPDLSSIDNVSLAASLTEVLKKLAEKRESEKPNPFLDELIRQLYMVRAFVIKKLRDGKLELFPDEETAVIRALEPYIRTGFLEEGKAFAAALDKNWNQGTRNRLHLVQLMRWNKQDPQALALLSQLHEAYKDNLDILFEMARIATENGDVHTAIFVYEDIIKKDQWDVTNRIELGDLYLEVGNVQKAFIIFEPIVSNMKDCDAMVGKLIQVAEYSEQRHMIISAAELADRLCPEDSNMMRKAADSLLAAGAEYKAIAFYSTYLRLNPDDIDAWRRLAELYSWTNKPKKAYGIYKKLTIQSKGKLEYVEEMIAMATSARSPDIIQEAITLASLLRPPDKTFKYKSAKLLLAAGLEKEAISAYQQYLTLNPDDEAAKQQLIRLYQWTDQQDKASDLLMQCSNKDPYSFEKALTAGNALVEMGNIEDGVTYLKRASLIKPDHIKIRKQLVTYYGWLDRTDLMVEELEFLNSVGKLPEKDRIFLAQTYLDRKKGNKALALLKLFESRKPLPTEEGLMLTSAYELLRQWDAVAAIYKRLAKENPDNANLLADLGNRALWMEKTDLALDFFESALKKDPKQLQALKGSAQIYASISDPGKAIDRFEDYNRLNPDDYEARYQLGELYFSSNREGEAFRQYRKALSLMKQTKPLTASNTLNNRLNPLRKSAEGPLEKHDILSLRPSNSP